MKSYDLTKGSVVKTLIVFAVPFLLANIIQSLYGAVDLLIIGRYCDAAYVAAVSTGTQVTQIITSLITGLTLGSTVVIGQYMGQKDYDSVRKAIGTTLTIFSIAAVILTIAMLVFERPLLRILNTPKESFEYTVRYVAVCSIGNIFICGYNAISAILRGYGDSTRPMIFVGISCTINIFLDIIFVKYCKLNVTGTALATVISQGISMVIAIVYLKKNNFIFDFKLKSFQPDKNIAKQLAKVGIPISFQELMIRISFLYLDTVMNRCGVYASSVIGISSKYDVFAMLSATSMASAIAAITAQNMGAGQPKRARKSLWYGLIFAIGIAMCFWLWAQINPQLMIGLFSKDSNVIKTGVPFFISCSYDYFLVAIVFILNGYLNGRQKTMWTMVSSTFGALVLRIPMVYYFGKVYSNDLGMLGRITPIVSGIMAVYTLIYVIFEGKKNADKI